MKKFLMKLDTLGLLILVISAIWYVFSSAGWGSWILGLAIAGVLCIIIGVVNNYRQIQTYQGKRSAKYAANYAFSIILVIALVFGLNFLVQKYPKRFDLTADSLYTQSPQTVQVLNELDKDLEIKAFFPDGDYPPLRELLAGYRSINSHIHFEFIDPNRQPTLARQYDVTHYGINQNPLTGDTIEYGTVVICYGDRQEKIEKSQDEIEEVALTNAIIRVRREGSKKVYFTQGHGENDLDDNGEMGYALVKEALKNQGYETASVQLLSEGIPDDAKVLVLAGPQKGLSSSEPEIIKSFLEKGGIGLLILADPPPSRFPEDLMKDWGISADNDLLLNRLQESIFVQTSPNIYVDSDSYENQPIVSNFSAATIFPFARSIEVENPTPDGVTADVLFHSHSSSWSKTIPSGRETSINPDFDPESDKQGPFTLAVAATKEIKPASDEEPGVHSRLIVVGSSSFAKNAYFRELGNSDLFLNMISWLAQDDDLISIRPKKIDDRRITFGPNTLKVSLFLAILILPGIALASGIIVFSKRRRR